MAILRALGFVWSLPVTLLGLLLAVWCKPSGWKWRTKGNWGGWILEFTVPRLPVRDMAATTFGHVQLYHEDYVEPRDHEDVHTFQGDLLGPLSVIYFLFAAALFIYWLFQARHPPTAFWLAYYDNPLEQWARAWSSPKSIRQSK